VELVTNEETFLLQLQQADIAIVESNVIGRDELLIAKNLKLIGNFGVLTNNIDLQACAARSIPVLTVRRRTNIAMAEHTLMLILSLAKRLPLINGLLTEDQLAKAGFSFKPYDSRHTAKANYGRIPDLRTLHGLKIGLLGLGEIGQEVAKLLKPFGMEVFYHKRQRLLASEEELLGVHYCSFNELFTQSEFLSVHIPFSDSTRGLVNHEALSRMPKGAYLINTSRAEIVDHDALVNTLASNHLAGAGCDVHYSEPTHPDEPLLQFPQMISTPHLGGASRMNGLMDAQNLLLQIQEQIKKW
jgi:phosphoglycerate dehydrogenase-like enzyme